MAKKDLPDNEEQFSIDTPDIEGADSGWDEWDDAEFDLDSLDDSLDADFSPSEEKEVDAEEAPLPASDVEDDAALAEEQAAIPLPSEEEIVSDLDVEEVAQDADVSDLDVEETAQAVDAPVDVVEAVADVPAPEEEVSAAEVTAQETETEAAAAVPSEETETESVVATSASAEAVASAPSADAGLDVAEFEVEDFEDADWGEEDWGDEDESTEFNISDEELREFLPPEPEPAPVQAAAEESAEPVQTEEELATEEEEALDRALEEPEAAKSDEEIKREQEELEAYRSAMGESNAEMADISEYRTFRKKTKTESKSSVPKKSDFDLFANRYKVRTMNAMVAASDPIVYFYNACIRADGSILAFNVYQVLQDRFLGKMVPQLFTAVAENSAKIEELNEANLIEQIKVCAEYPQYDFIVSISARFFTKPALLDRLLRVIPEGGMPNLVLAFDCTSLESIAIAAKAGLGAVRQKGVKILLDNTEKVTMTVLSEFDYDMIRIDSRYYEIGNPRAEAYLRLLLSLTKEQNVTSIATFCDSEDLSEYMFFMGVDSIQGNATSRPMRTVPNAVRGITLLPSMLDA